MYVSITGNKVNQDVYIKQSYRKDNGKTSSRIHKKLGKYNDLLTQFSGDETKLMNWAKEEAEKETILYNQRKEKITVSFSPLARIPLDEERLFNVGYLFLQQLCTELRLDNICRNIRNHHKFIYDFHAILTDLIYAICSFPRRGAPLGFSGAFPAVFSGGAAETDPLETSFFGGSFFTSDSFSAFFGAGAFPVF